MHDAVADRAGQISTDLLAQEGDDLVERRRRVAHLRSRPRLIDEGLSLDVPGQEVRACADALDLSFEAALELVVCTDFEQLKFDARAACVDHEDGFGHGSGPDRVVRSSTVSKQHGHGAGRHARPQVVRP